MKIAILSGKGGTGKTFVSVNLAASINNMAYIDCDVEAPDGELFLKPIIEEIRDVSVAIPSIKEEKCMGCKACVTHCKFNALAFIREKPILFKEVCHSCGLCEEVCPNKAIYPIDRKVGVIKRGKSADTPFLSGLMNIGEASGTPIIKTLLNEVVEKDAVIDCPPGSGCLVTETIRHADYCVVVAEPTRFGEHNLRMIYELVTTLGVPFGVILNKNMDGMNPSEAFCIEHHIPILYRLNYDKRVAVLNANGKIVALEDERYKHVFTSIYKLIKEEVGI